MPRRGMVGPSSCPPLSPAGTASGGADPAGPALCGGRGRLPHCRGEAAAGVPAAPQPRPPAAVTAPRAPVSSSPFPPPTAAPCLHPHPVAAGQCPPGCGVGQRRPLHSGAQDFGPDPGAGVAWPGWLLEARERPPGIRTWGRCGSACHCARREVPPPHSCLPPTGDALALRLHCWGAPRDIAQRGQGGSRWPVARSPPPPHPALAGRGVGRWC